MSSETKVVTYQSPRGDRLSVCPRHEDAASERRDPVDGSEYCDVYHGLHVGDCDLCREEEE